MGLYNLITTSLTSSETRCMVKGVVRPVQKATSAKGLCAP